VKQIDSVSEKNCTMSERKHPYTHYQLLSIDGKG